MPEMPEMPEPPAGAAPPFTARELRLLDVALRYAVPNWDDAAKCFAEDAAAGDLSDARGGELDALRAKVTALAGTPEREARAGGPDGPHPNDEEWGQVIAETEAMADAPAAGDSPEAVARRLSLRLTTFDPTTGERVVVVPGKIPSPGDPAPGSPAGDAGPDITPAGRRRLARLAAVLEADPRAWPEVEGARVEFDLNEWTGVRDDDGVVPFGEFDATDPEAECGTTCCAAGLAARLPEFQAEGFTAGADETPVYRDGEAGQNSWSAVTAFFGLPSAVASPTAGDPFLDDRTEDFDPNRWRLAHRVFHASCYPPADRTNPRAVAARIRRLLTGDPLADWHVPPATAETPTGATACV